MFLKIREKAQVQFARVHITWCEVHKWSFSSSLTLWDTTMRRMELLLHPIVITGHGTGHVTPYVSMPIKFPVTFCAMYLDTSEEPPHERIKDQPGEWNRVSRPFLQTGWSWWGTKRPQAKRKMAATSQQPISCNQPAANQLINAGAARVDVRQAGGRRTRTSFTVPKLIAEKRESDATCEDGKKNGHHLLQDVCVGFILNWSKHKLTIC